MTLNTTFHPSDAYVHTFHPSWCIWGATAAVAASVATVDWSISCLQYIAHTSKKKLEEKCAWPYTRVHPYKTDGGYSCHWRTEVRVQHNLSLAFYFVFYQCETISCFTVWYVYGDGRCTIIYLKLRVGEGKLQTKCIEINWNEIRDFSVGGAAYLCYFIFEWKGLVES